MYQIKKYVSSLLLAQEKPYKKGNEKFTVETELRD